MAKHLPWFKFFPGDWRKDPDLARLTHAAKGVWIDMLCLMFECEERGVLATAGQAWTIDEIARAVGGDQAVTLSCVAEIVEKRVAGRGLSGAVYSRRMVHDEEIRSIRSTSGSAGGFATAKSQQKSSKHPSKPLSKPLTMTSDSDPEYEIRKEEGTPFDSLDGLPVNTDSPADHRHGALYDAVSMFKRWPTEADMAKWRKLADDALGEERVIDLLRDGHTAGKRPHKILMAGWETANLEGKAEVRISVKEIEATAKQTDHQRMVDDILKAREENRERE